MSLSRGALLEMTGLGQKRRFEWPSVTSAPTRGADVGTDRWRVSNGPFPDIVAEAVLHWRHLEGDIRERAKSRHSIAPAR
jgi:hypothetical protein